MNDLAVIISVMYDFIPGDLILFYERISARLRPELINIIEDMTLNEFTPGSLGIIVSVVMPPADVKYQATYAYVVTPDGMAGWAMMCHDWFKRV